jgi:leader peptidase (prepilin peptidase)/N-methyltransferase
MDLLSQYIFVTVFGLFVGSFANVCIWRIPRVESVVFPASHCPSCGKPVKPWDNIPVLSYFVLRGKCRSCGEKISPRYPLVEVLNAVLYVLVLWRFGIGWHLPVYLVLVTALVIIAFIDIDYQIIPDAITLPGAVVALIAGSLVLPDPFLRSHMLGWKAALTGAAVGFGLYYAIAEISFRLLGKQGMGGGDIKLMAMAGALTGWKGVLLTTFAGSLSGAVIGLVVIARKGKSEGGTYIPFGPFLILGILITLFFGQEIFAWYWHVEH